MNLPFELDVPSNFFEELKSLSEAERNRLIEKAVNTVFEQLESNNDHKSVSARKR